MSVETSLAIYNPSPFYFMNREEGREYLLNELFRRSFSLQQADASRLSLTQNRASILAGALPRPMVGGGLPAPYPGSCRELCDTIASTLDETANSVQFNGLLPFITMIPQLEEGRNFLETELQDIKTSHATSCVGMCHLLLERLQKLHGVEGAVAAQRKGTQQFEHVCVIVECSDGYVFLDPILPIGHRMFSIPFNEARITGYLISSTETSLDFEVPFLETFQEIQGAKNPVRAKTHHSLEDPNSGIITVGMDHRAYYNQLIAKHGAKGAAAALGDRIVRCTTGFIFVDPFRGTGEIMFSRVGTLCCNGSDIIMGLASTAPGSTTPLLASYREARGAKTMECCTNIANAEDLVHKYFVMNAPFEEGSSESGNPAISMTVRTVDRDLVRAIFVSPLQSTMTFKNMNIPQGEAGRTTVLSFQEIQEGALSSVLPALYDETKGATFPLSPQELEGQLIAFARGAHAVNRVFHDIHERNGPIVR